MNAPLKVQLGEDSQTQYLLLSDVVSLVRREVTIDSEARACSSNRTSTVPRRRGKSPFRSRRATWC
jgi:hypothetical protein